MEQTDWIPTCQVVETAIDLHGTDRPAPIVRACGIPEHVTYNL